MTAPSKSATLVQAYDAAAFRQVGHELIDLLADHLEKVQNEKVDHLIHYRDPETELAFWQEDFANTPAEPMDFFRKILDHSTHVHHPHYIGHQISVPAPVNALAGMVSDVLSNGTGVYDMGMSSNALERVVTDFTAQKIGFDTSASGFLTSGGTLANLTAVLAARSAKASGEVWENGHQGRLAIMVSAEAHYCVDRAARILGMGKEGIIKVPVDDHFRIRTELLEEYYQNATERGLQVIAIVGCAGSTATGSYDDLQALAAFSRKHDLWFHVDGAHGGAVIFSERYRHLVAGIEQADTVVLDYHKMLMTPALNTALIFREGQRSYETFQQRAQYLWEAQQSPEWYHSGKRTFECTKLMLSIKVYATLRTYGPEVFGDNVERLYDQAKAFAQLLNTVPDFELAVEPEANIVNFRYTNMARESWDIENTKIRQRLVDSGRFYIVQTIIRGEKWLRVAIMNPHTDVQHFRALLDEIRQLPK
ncbi:MAG: pyridoxal-dependent decarboxylase [Bacteroidota bacterium]